MEITNSKQLEEAIQALEIKHDRQKAELSRSFSDFKESMKPAHLLKSAVSKIAQPGDIRNTLLKAVGGIGVGMLTKGLLNGKSSSAVGSMVTNALKVSAGKMFYNNADKLNAYGTAIYHNLFRKKK